MRDSKQSNTPVSFTFGGPVEAWGPVEARGPIMAWAYVVTCELPRTRSSQVQHEIQQIHQLTQTTKVTAYRQRASSTGANELNSRFTHNRKTERKMIIVRRITTITVGATTNNKWRKELCIIVQTWVSPSSFCSLWSDKIQRIAW